MAGLSCKVLRMWAESSTNGLWDEHGQTLFPDELGLSPAITQRLERWAEWFEDFDGHLPASMRPGPLFPLDAFNAEGRAIAAILQSELPDWTVTYKDEPLEYSRNSQR